VSLRWHCEARQELEQLIGYFGYRYSTEPCTKGQAAISLQYVSAEADVITEKVSTRLAVLWNTSTASLRILL
jgi:hypothetical protein